MTVRTEISSHQKTKQTITLRFREKQMIEKGVEFEVFPLVFDANKFSFAKFYSAYISSEMDEINFNQLQPAQKLEDLNIRIQKKVYKKRVLLRMDFCFDSVNKIGIKMFSLFKKFKKTGTVVTDKEGTSLRRISKTICTETGEAVPKDLIGNCFSLGDEKVHLPTDELLNIKNVSDISFSLVGFKPSSALKIHHNIKESIFVIADDQRILNSSRFADALIKEMIEHDKIAIVKLKFTKNSGIRFGALIAQQEKNANEKDFVPNGFHLVTLPFANETRKVEQIFHSQKDDVREDELICAVNLIRELTVDDFDPKSFENAAIQRFYKILQGLSLNQSEIEPIIDSMEPDIEGLESKIDVLKEFNLCFFNEAEISETVIEKKSQRKKKEVNAQISESPKIHKIEKKSKNASKITDKTNKNSNKLDEVEKTKPEIFSDNHLNNLPEVSDDKKMSKSNQKHKIECDQNEFINSNDETKNENGEILNNKSEVDFEKVEEAVLKGSFASVRVEDLKQFAKFKGICFKKNISKAKLISEIQNIMSESN